MTITAITAVDSRIDQITASNACSPQPATKLNYWWSQALKVMGFVMLAMMIVRVLMAPRMTLVVGMLEAALLASIG